MFYRSRVFDGFGDLLGNFDRLLGSGLDEALPQRRPLSLGGSYPTVESFKRDGRLVLRAEVPGVSKADLDVTVENGRLILSGEKRADGERNEGDYHVRETRYGRFERTFVLPDEVNADAVSASLSDGILEVTLPLVEPARGRRIEVSSEETKQAA